ncbi:hypothetical protein FQN60_012056 [Etheostoma spectabile]|uniref:Uncharacterized protein n=1 Tax=Etheostoma spectabile TaxID=54343 RepID=A0A5J5DNJ8_9PERO|nr:hypothetical protein FQN60_012056 [Etheostoma spectabile]
MEGRGWVVKMGATPPPKLSQSNMPPSNELVLPKLRGLLGGGPDIPRAEAGWWCRVTHQAAPVLLNVIDSRVTAAVAVLQGGVWRAVNARDGSHVLGSAKQPHDPSEQDRNHAEMSSSTSTNTPSGHRLRMCSIIFNNDSPLKYRTSQLKHTASFLPAEILSTPSFLTSSPLHLSSSPGLQTVQRFIYILLVEAGHA